MSLAMKTDFIYRYLLLSLGCSDRWQIYLSHINTLASTAMKVSDLNKPELLKYPHLISQPTGVTLAYQTE